MSINLDLKRIDANAAQFAPMLSHLQGNILKGHGRDHTVHFFLRFNVTGTHARSHVKQLANRYVTSALKQRDDSNDFKTFGIPGTLFGNLLLSSDGYRALGFTDAEIDEAFDQEPVRSAGDAVKSSFKTGMKEFAQDDFNDPPVIDWEEGFQGRIDAMLLLADDDPQLLLREAHAALGRLREFCDIVHVEHGHALRTPEGEGIEHFGYVDGRSQPLYFSQDFNQDEGPTDVWDPAEPLKRVLVADPMLSVVGANAADAFGSYFVFRKLEQNVLGFKTRERELAEALNLADVERERAGAMAVGRFEDGTPVALSRSDGFVPVKDNNFTYDVDADGLKCPFQAHIRKANPRGDIERKLVPGGDLEQLERSRRVTRRGIPFGQRDTHPQSFQSLDELPSHGVGLLFMCFGSSIANQFGFMQKSWINNADFVLPGTGVDPVVAENDSAPVPQEWPTEWGKNGKTPFSFEGFVHFKGGEFFFAPSIPFFKKL